MPKELVMIDEEVDTTVIGDANLVTLVLPTDAFIAPHIAKLTVSQTIQLVTNAMLQLGLCVDE